MTRYIPLSRNKFTVVDDQDYEWLNQWKWSFQPFHFNGYAVRNDRTSGKLIQVRMHRVIMNPPYGMFVDHIDGDGLNNVRENLRICSRGQNAQNTPGKRTRKCQYKGVYLYQGKYHARICVNQKEIYIGSYAVEAVAARAYDKAARHYHGCFAYLNFPD